MEDYTFTQEKFKNLLQDFSELCIRVGRLEELAGLHEEEREEEEREESNID